MNGKESSQEKAIPIVVGVTGHRAIRLQDREALRTSVREELLKLREFCPNTPLRLLCSLAEGGDLLCADVAEELGIPLVAVLPMERELTAKDYSSEDRARFEAHCARALRVFVAPRTEAVPQAGITRSDLFRQAGIYVSAHCHVLLALWDGGPGTAAACGTAEAVDFSLHGSYYPATGVSLRSDSNEAVIHIFTPRRERCEEKAGTVHVLGNEKAVREVLSRTNEFNRLAAALPEPKRSLLPPECEKDPVMRHMERIYLSASALSTLSAKRFRRVLALLAAASCLLTLAFLLYDEAQLIWMIFVCGAMLLCAWACLRYAVRSDCHRRYIEYRALAECLRVQIFLRHAGSGVRASEQLSWTQQEETAWILDALCALELCESAKQTHEIRECWVEGQREYHRKAGKKALSDSALSERTVQTALILSIGLYVVALFFELCFGSLASGAGRLPNADSYRTVLKIVLGTISAVTLFIANYYGRLSLSRKLSDHVKMERFFEKMSTQLAQRGQTEELLAVLAREELAENANWCAYQRDNKPNVSF